MIELKIPDRTKGDAFTSELEIRNSLKTPTNGKSEFLFTRACVILT